jgi:septal ring-binding cell division protein DamX
MNWRRAWPFLGMTAACLLFLALAVAALLHRAHSPVAPTPVDVPDVPVRETALPDDFGSLSALVPFAGGISPVATAVVPAATEHAPEFRDAAWLRAQHPDSFTLQVLAARDEESVKRFLAGRADRSAFVYFVHPQDGVDWFVVTMGSFASRELAAGVAASRDDLPSRPFPKQMSAYQDTAAGPAAPGSAAPAPAAPGTTEPAH